ncbi:glycosyltransferase family 4 protein [Roseovarius sp. CH_XMU1461]|uniref:glycosyltransferase family 4 protein n=1 Tax=Roseovarius sp. CH_XMU1461 TaxID=3107777 RepID=UPI00300856B7
MRIMIVGNGFTRLGPANRHYVNRHTANFLTDLARHGHVITLAQPFVHDTSEAGLNDGVLPKGQISSLQLAKNRPLPMLRGLVALVRADFVYLFFPGSWSRLFGRLCQMFGKRFGVYLRGAQFSDTDADAQLLRRAAFVCTVAGMETRAGVQQSWTIPIAPMLDLSAEDQLSRDFRAGGDRPLRILFTGRLEVEKGIPELIEAMRILHRQGFHFEAQLVGGGPLYKGLAETLAGPDAPPVRLTGLIDQKVTLMSLYEWADVFVLPTHHEGFPRVLYEAMIKSCVILTTFVGGIPSLMKDGRNCIRLDVKDPQGIVEAILRLSRDRAQMQAMSDAARLTVLDVLATRPSHFDAFQEALHEES